MFEPDPHGVMADTKGRLQFLERGGGLFANVRLKFGRIKLAPDTPAGFGGQGVGFGGGEVAIDRAWGDTKAPGSLGFGAAGLDILHHPFPQIQRIGFHAHIVSPYLPMSM